MSATGLERQPSPPGSDGPGREAAPAPEALSVGPLEIAPAEHLARAGGQALTLSIRELGLLTELALPGWSFIHTHFGFGYRLAPTPRA